MVGSEIAIDAGIHATGVVGPQLGDAADDDSFAGEDKGVVGIDRVDELGADGLPDVHGQMIFSLNREWCPCRQADNRSLRKREA
jgi:hypothetical protein